MAKYIVKQGQNIYDVALQLYGSIEGLFDLLITNENLSLNDDLTPGQELEYHDYFIVNRPIKNEIDNNKYVVANGESNIYFTEPIEGASILIKAVEDTTSVVIKAMGEEVFSIDWGDGVFVSADIAKENAFKHYFNNREENKNIYVYADNLSKLTINNISGDFAILKPIVINQLTMSGFKGSLLFLELVNALNYIDISKSSVDSLKPLYNKLELTHIDMSKAFIKQPNATEEYLEYIIANYNDRKAADVYLNQWPSERTKAAIETIKGNEEWNSEREWRFFIGDILFDKFIIGESIIGKNTI